MSEPEDFAIQSIIYTLEEREFSQEELLGKKITIEMSDGTTITGECAGIDYPLNKLRLIKAMLVQHEK